MTQELYTTIKGMDSRMIFMSLNKIPKLNPTSWPEIFIIDDIKVTNSGNFLGYIFFGAKWKATIYTDDFV